MFVPDRGHKIGMLTDDVQDGEHQNVRVLNLQLYFCCTEFPVCEYQKLSDVIAAHVDAFVWNNIATI